MFCYYSIVTNLPTFFVSLAKFLLKCFIESWPIYQHFLFLSFKSFKSHKLTLDSGNQLLQCNFNYKNLVFLHAQFSNQNVEVQLHIQFWYQLGFSKLSTNFTKSIEITYLRVSFRLCMNLSTTKCGKFMRKAKLFET